MNAKANGDRISTQRPQVAAAEFRRKGLQDRLTALEHENAGLLGLCERCVGLLSTKEELP